MKSEVNKQLNSRVIELAISESAAPVLFEPKKRPPPLLYQVKKIELHDCNGYISPIGNGRVHRTILHDAMQVLWVRV